MKVTNKEDFYKYLNEHDKGHGVYAIVEYNNIKKAIYFSNLSSVVDNNLWYLESPCCLITRGELKDEETREDAESLIEDEYNEDVNDYIDNYITPMMRNSILYEIENPQTSPFLPNEIEVDIISET